MNIRRGKEDLLTETTTDQGSCQVRSGTDRPCYRPAVARIRGIPFCEPCAREQEAYFAIGELTQEPRQLHDKQLVGMLSRMRRTRLVHGVADEHESDAA